MSTSKELRELLAEEGITSGKMLAESMGSKGVIFFMRNGLDWSDSRAELHFGEGGRTRRMTYRPTGEGLPREDCLHQAREDARERLGVTEWSRAPFSNCWLPSDDISRMHQNLEWKLVPDRG